MAEQNSTAYEPTKAEQKLLEVMLQPENRLKTVSDICRLAEIDRKTYYKAFDKPDFVAIYRVESRRLVERCLAPVVNACIKQAVLGSHQHAKIILGMAGEYSEKHEFSGPNGGPIETSINVIFVNPDGASGVS